MQLEPVAVAEKDIRPLGLRARDFTGLSLAAYVNCLKDTAAAHTDKIRAATELLNRGYGRSVEVVHATSTNLFAGLTDGDIITAIRALRSAPVDGDPTGNCIDVTPGETVADGVGAASGLQASAAPDADAVEAGEDRERRD